MILFSKNPKKIPLTAIRFSYNGNNLFPGILKSRAKSLSTDKQQEFNTKVWKLDELIEPIEFEKAYSFFINAFIVKGNHVLIFCNKIMMSCKMDDLSNMTSYPLDILKNYEEVKDIKNEEPEDESSEQKSEEV